MQMTPELYIECSSKADWIRFTQFAGDHPHCERHARMESDFNESDSYAYWYRVNISEISLAKEEPMQNEGGCYA